VEVLFNVAFYGSETPAQRALLGKSHLIADLRLFMRSHHIDSIIVLPLGRHPATVVRYVDAAIGPPSASKQGTVWLDVKQRLATASLHPH
jgi:hypothetical protein